MPYFCIEDSNVTTAEGLPQFEQRFRDNQQVPGLRKEQYKASPSETRARRPLVVYSWEHSYDLQHRPYHVRLKPLYVKAKNNRYCERWSLNSFEEQSRSLNENNHLTRKRSTKIYIEYELTQQGQSHSSSPSYSIEDPGSGLNLI